MKEDHWRYLQGNGKGWVVFFCVYSGNTENSSIFDNLGQRQLCIDINIVDQIANLLIIT